jgi:predicted DNA-binding transcriptional regulator YafY
MRADRLLSALLLLQAHGKLTGRELARRLEVSQRTAHRDMESLSAAGVPVYALRGARGGWQLDEEWRTRVPGLDESELRALLMAQPRMIGDTRLAAAAERAIEKLMAALPVSLRERAANIRQRLFVDTTGWRGTTENLAALPIVQDAVARDRKLEIKYRRADQEEVERSLDPLGLVAKGTTWYLVAQSDAGLRTYRVSRIKEAITLEIQSQRPANFDLAAYWKSSTEEFQASRTRYEATLRLSPRVAENVKEWRLTSVVEGPTDPNGWVTLRVQFEDVEHASFMVRGFGPYADVIAPEGLRERINADLDAALARRGSQHRA